MFGRAIWYKQPECIFENFEILTCDYWLITPNQQTLSIKLIPFNSGQLQISERVIDKITPLTVQYRLESIVSLMKKLSNTELEKSVVYKGKRVFLSIYYTLRLKKR